MASPKLALGTVQFGADYGVTNANGRVREEEVRRILAAAAAALPGLLLDTAPSYGASEEVLGRAMRELGIAASVITKTDAGSEQIRPTFERSLRKLQLSNVYALIDHNAANLLGPEGDKTFAVLGGLKRDGLVRNIGASVYRSEEIDLLLERYSIDLIQLPYSIVDQRLAASGHLRKLKQAGVEVHARSVFLQGALLSQPADLPGHLRPLARTLDSLRSEADRAGISMLRQALGFVLAEPCIDRAVVGVSSLHEFEEILAAADPCAVSGAERFALKAPELVEPARWPQ